MKHTANLWPALEFSLKTTKDCQSAVHIHGNGDTPLQCLGFKIQGGLMKAEEAKSRNEVSF
jgi:hypothetical protein